MPGKSLKNPPKPADPASSSAQKPATTPGPSNSEMQDRMKGSLPPTKDVYQEAADKAKAAKPEPKQKDEYQLAAEAAGYDIAAEDKKQKKQKPIKAKTADELRKEEKGDPKVPSGEQGKQGAVHWAEMQYMLLLMGPVGHEYDVFGAAFNPWSAAAANSKTSKADRKKLPKLAKEVLQHGQIAVDRIDKALKTLDGRHQAVLKNEGVAGERDMILQVRATIVMGMERAKQGADPSEEEATKNAGIIGRPEDPAMKPGGWSPDAPKK